MTWVVLRALLLEAAPRLLEALLAGRPPEAITLGDLLSDQRLQDLRRAQARERARRRLGL